MKKRIIAAILSCCMLLGTCGVAYAEEESSNTNAGGAVVISDDVDENQEVDADTEDDAETNEDESDSFEEVDYDEDDDLEDIASNYTMEEDEIVQVDEYGNVTIVDPSQIGDGVVDVPMIATYANTEQIVNFRANENGIAIPTNCVVSYTEYKTGKSGYINGVAGADAAYLGEQNGKVKFMMSGVIGLVDKSAVQVVSMNDVKSYSYYDTNGTYLYHRICTDMSTPGYASSINVGKTPSYLKAGMTYYSYDGHYFYTDYSTMLSDYRADTRSHAVNAGNPYYNYFQYLPLRSATSYSGSELSNTINGHTNSSSKMYNMGNVFVEKQNLYGTNALLVASIGALESAWGTSAIVQAKNNLFGWNAVDATPGPSASYFASAAACIDEYTGIHLSQEYLRAGYSTYHGAFLGNKSSGMNVSYASDPYWGEKIAGIAWSMDTERGSKDQYKYKLGIKDTVTYNVTSLNVRSEATTSSTVLYQTGNNAHYSFIILGESNGFYKIQSDSVLNSARTAVVSNSGNYNAAKMYAYASKDYIKVVNNGNGGNSDIIIGEASGGSNDKVKIELPYIDVAENQWYYDAVSVMYEKGIMTGLNETTFGPAELLSRAHFATMMYRLEGKPAVTYKNLYRDIANGIWYTNPIVWCNQSGIITGYGNGLFGPADAITREQVALILYRYTSYKGYDNRARNNLSSYSDASRVSGFAKEAMQWAVGCGVISGKNNETMLDPQGNASRAECATMVVRLLNIYK